MEQSVPLQKEIEDLRARLTEAEEALEAIRSGGVDALVIYGEEGERVYTLQGAEYPYRVMIESINEGAATLSTEGMILYANLWLASMLKLPLHFLLGTPFSRYLAPQDRDTFLAIFGKSLHEKQKTELELLTTDGTRVPILLSLSPVVTPEEVSVCLIATDISQQKHNAEIQAAERIARSIIDQAAEAIVVCDDAGSIIRASRDARHMASQNPLLKPFDEVFPLRFITSSGADHPFTLRKVLDGDEFLGLEASLEYPPRGSEEGSNYDLIVSATRLDIPGNKNLGCVITMTDVTEQKRAQKAIQRYAQQLERSNKDLQDFAFIASHDLQEPLRKIRAFGQRLKEDYSHLLREEGSDFIDRIQNAAVRMQKNDR